MNLGYTPRVLVADDEAAVCASLIGYLNDRDVRTISADDGQAAVKSIIYNKPDVVLLDLGLPGIGGLDVLRQAREAGSDSAIIIMSGNGMMDDVIESLRLGACDYISKPIHDLELLDHRLTKAIERIQLLHENRRYRENLEEQVKLRTAQIENANRSLEAKNVALGEVLASVETERKKFGNQVSKHVESVILPTLRSLTEGLNWQQRRIVDQIEQGLHDIVSPFIDKVSRYVATLSPTELRICSFINRGLAVKQIAEMEHLSPETIAAHRRNIRRKLGISNQKINLAVYLRSIFDDASVVTQSEAISTI